MPEMKCTTSSRCPFLLFAGQTSCFHLFVQESLKAYDDYLYARPEAEEGKSSVVKGNKLAGSKKLARFAKLFESKVKKTVAAVKATQASPEQIALQQSQVKESAIPLWAEKQGEAAKNNRTIQLHVLEAVNIETNQKNRLSTPYCKVLNPFLNPSLMLDFPLVSSLSLGVGLVRGRFAASGVIIVR